MKTAIELAAELDDLIDLHAAAYVVRAEAAAMLRTQAQEIESLRKEIEAAQKLITALKLDRQDVDDWPKDSFHALIGLERAIAQERAVFPKLVSGTSERSCDTCSRRKRRMHEEPCRSCHGYSNWEQEP